MRAPSLCLLLPATLALACDGTEHTDARAGQLPGPLDHVSARVTLTPELSSEYSSLTYYGSAVAGAGDVDGDGYDDVLIGGDTYETFQGAAWLYMGNAAGVAVDTEERIVASDALVYDRFGASLAGAVDLDGDGYDDVIVGAPGDRDATIDGAYQAGAVYVYHGSSTGLDLSTEQQIHASDARTEDTFGTSVAGAGDLDGDGYDDIVVGAPGDDDGATSGGAVYVYSGSSAGLDEGSEEQVHASDASSSAAFGNAVAGGGDVNGDGYDDVVVGAHQDDGAATGAGAAYVYLGSASGLDTSTELKLTASTASRYDIFGTSVAMAGDVDADGYDDVVVGVPYAGARFEGAAFLYYGSASGIAADSEEELLDSDGEEGDSLGVAVAGAGDVDADGYDDVILGGFTWEGKALLLFGSPSGLVQSPDESELNPESTNYLGAAVAGLGDVDADGYADVVAGAPQTPDDGAAVVYPGGCRDEDGDGVCTTDDCDDSDASTYPGAAETVADGADNDCDGLEICYVDADEDGYTSGTTTSSDLTCTSPGLRATASSEEDCDESDDSIHPGAIDTVGDEVDADCDGAEVCYADADDDGYIHSAITVPSTDTDCTDPGEGRATDPTGDCDDDDATVHPGATELVGDEVDQDCDRAETCYADADDDGYIDGTTTVPSSDTDCTDAGEGRTTDPTGECDDDDATVHPGATELAGDEVDQDCDGAEVCYVDADDDGVIVAGGATVDSSDTDCTDPGEGLATDAVDDCDDTEATTYPGAPELVGDEVDQDCDGAEICHADTDNDGHTDGATTVASTDLDCTDAGEGLATDPTGDCDDSDPTVNPAATDAVGDEVDSDCDGVELCYADLDGDGYSDGSTVPSTEDVACDGDGEVDAGAPLTDCDDGDPEAHPGATEICDDLDLDEDCDGLADDADDSVYAPSRSVFYADADGDGFGDPETTVEACDEPAGYVAAPGSAADFDCDDDDPDTYPGAEEVADDGVDQDCDGEDLESPGGDGPDDDDDTGGGPDDGDGDGDGDGKVGCATAPDTGATRSHLALLGLVALLGLRRRR